MIMVGFERSNPNCAMIRIEISKQSESNFLVENMPFMSHIFTGDQNGLLSGGIQKHSLEHQKQGVFDPLTATPEKLIQLISLESAENEYVGKGVNYVIIKDGSSEFGRNIKIN